MVGQTELYGCMVDYVVMRGSMSVIVWYELGY